MNLMGTNTPDAGKRLTRYLQAEWDAKGTTRGAWCRKVGINDSTVSRWASDGNEPDIRNLRLVARELNLTMTEILVICGYMSEAEAGQKEPSPRERPTVAESIRLDPNISEDERAALLALHDAFSQASNGHRTKTRIRSARTSR